VLTHLNNSIPKTLKLLARTFLKYINFDHLANHLLWCLVE